MNSLDPLIGALCARLVKLSEVQYRLVLLGAVVSGGVVLYQSLSSCVGGLAGNMPNSRQQMQDRYVQRETLQGELFVLERRLAQYRSNQDEDVFEAGKQREDLVHAIDRAVRRTSVRVNGLVRAGTSGELRHSYQLSVGGGYGSIVEFITVLVEQPSSTVIAEVMIHAAGWMYPAQPLEARLILEVHPSTKKNEPLAKTSPARERPAIH